MPVVVSVCVKTSALKAVHGDYIYIVVVSRVQSLVSMIMKIIKTWPLLNVTLCSSGVYAIFGNSVSFFFCFYSFRFPSSKRFVTASILIYSTSGEAFSAVSVSVCSTVPPVDPAP